MNPQSTIAQLRKQLDEAKAAELAAMAEFHRYGTRYYDEELTRAIEKSREIEEMLSLAEEPSCNWLLPIALVVLLMYPSGQSIFRR